jgi:hypothetical protein
VRNAVVIGNCISIYAVHPHNAHNANEYSHCDRPRLEGSRIENEVTCISALLRQPYNITQVIQDILYKTSQLIYSGASAYIRRSIVVM